jgi:hypothetical protein
MGFFAPGTVQMTLQKGEVKLRVDPISDYRVRYKMKNQSAKEYTVFVVGGASRSGLGQSRAIEMAWKDVTSCSASVFPCVPWNCVPCWIS